MTEFLSDFINYIELISAKYINELKISSIIGAIAIFTKFIFKKINTVKNDKKLSYHFERNTASLAQENYIKTKCQNVDPSDEINLKSSFAFAAKEDLLKFFLKKVFKNSNTVNKFYLILADSGMGKTTFMVNLYIRYNTFVNSLLNKSKMTLLPLGIGYEELIVYLGKIQNKENHILLLDGFDELPESNNENIEEYFHKIIDQTKDYKTVIFTCRTHYFSSEKDEPNELKIKKFNTRGNGFHSVKKMYISPFDETDIKKYINRTFNIFQLNQKKRAYEIVKNTDDLLFRPMLLSYIKDLIKYNNEKIFFKVDVYEILIASWLERETNKYPEKERLDFKKNLAFFSYELSRLIYENFDDNGLYITLEEVERLSKEYKIDLTKIELKSRSLLNRNSKGLYKFSHKSIFEFLLAYLAYNSRWQHQDNVKIEYNVHKFYQALIFFEEMVLSGKLSSKLPDVYDKFDGTNKELIRKIMYEKKRNKINYNTQIEWVDDFNYKILR